MNAQLDELRKMIDTEWARIIARHHYRVGDTYISGREIMLEHTQLADTIIRQIVAGARHEGILPEDVSLTIIALGGYGREELNPHSDIDILILYDPARCPRDVLQEFAGHLITMLWDLRFEVGHSVRTVRECRHAVWADSESRTAMLEGRYITGSRKLYQKFEREIKHRAMRRGARAYVDEKIGDWRAQMGDPKTTVYVQEPDVKNGIGGLRSVHIARWVARARFGTWELSDLVRNEILPENVIADYAAGVDFLWRVRNELHYLSGRRMDQLSLSIQEKVAKGLGYVDRGRELAEEQLMRDYFKHAQWIHECARIIIMQSRWEWSSWRKCLDRLAARHITPEIVTLRERLRLTPHALANAFEEGRAEALLIQLFYHRAKVDLPLSVTTRQQIVEGLPRIGETFASSPVVQETFLDILSQRDHVGATLREMHYLGVLSRLIPEFEHLRALVRYDLYHKYTVDEHTLIAVGNVDLPKFEDAPHGASLAAVFDDLDAADRVTLRLGILLHDLGKGMSGDGGHVEKGVQMCTESILPRFTGLSGEQKEDILFLVEQHHLMSHTAQRRDLDDPGVIERYAKAVGSLKRARMLYLLTYADIRAVNPDLWTDWTATLLNKLHTRAEHYFKGEFQPDADQIEAMCEQVIEMMGPEWDEAVREHIRLMGQERMAFYSPAEIAAQVDVVAELSEERPCALTVFSQSESYSSVVFAAQDRPGLFAQIAGVLTAADVNILSADLNTRKDKIAVDTLHITDGTTGRGIDAERAAQLEALLEKVRHDEDTVIDMLTRRKHRKPPKRGPRTFEMETNVRINNDDSRDYTIIDVRARDRIGLLYTITRTLSELGLDISLAKISTEAYRAVDVFYVSDAEGGKIRDPARLEHIRQTLTEALDAGE